jgi:AP-1 complex subunit mu
MAGAASALFLLDIKGRVLVWRDYRGDVSAVQAERFFTKFIEKEVSFLTLLLLRFSFI